MTIREYVIKQEYESEREEFIFESLKVNGWDLDKEQDWLESESLRGAFSEYIAQDIICG